jgi:nucleotide-binding universal stress UspA family protein
MKKNHQKNFKNKQTNEISNRESCMKFKPNGKPGGVAMELAREESQLPVEAVEVRTAPSPIFSLKRILVPVDFTDCSNKALTYAVALAQQFEAELTLLNVVPTHTYPEMAALDLLTDPMPGAKKELEILRLMVGSAAECDTTLRRGMPATEIVAVAKELRSDLIVISTHGHKGLTHAILGSTTEKVLRHAPCPVLVVREKEHEFIRPPVLYEK